MINLLEVIMKKTKQKNIKKTNKNINKIDYRIVKTMNMVSEIKKLSDAMKISEYQYSSITRV